MNCTACDRNTERRVNKASLLLPCKQCKSWDPVIGTMGAFKQTRARVGERWTGRRWDEWSVLLKPKMIRLPLPTRRPPSMPSWSTALLLLPSNSPALAFGVSLSPGPLHHSLHHFWCHILPGTYSVRQTMLFRVLSARTLVSLFCYTASRQATSTHTHPSPVYSFLQEQSRTPWFSHRNWHFFNLQSGFLIMHNFCLF